MSKKYYKFDGMNNYIEMPKKLNLFPVHITVRIPKEHNRSTIHPIIQCGKKKLTYNELRKIIKDEEYHHLQWDGNDVWIDDKFYKL